MRGLIAPTALVLAWLVVQPGCARSHRQVHEKTSPASSIFAADPSVASQFAQGFYPPEQNAWRWTGKTFAVDLSPPLHSDQNGAELAMKIMIPDSEIQKLSSVQLSASIQGDPLAAETYSKAGQYTYTRDVPADKLRGHLVRIDFSVDHTLPPSASEQRELGIIVSEVGLVAK